MNAFESELYLRVLGPEELKANDLSRQNYELTEDLRYHSERFGLLVAPKGMLTDFASIPRIAFSYLDPEDPVILRPSVIHDALYQAGGKLGARTLSRAESDEHHAISRLEQARALEAVERDRKRSGGRVARAGHIPDDALGRKIKLRRDGLGDAQVRLVGDQPREV